MRSPVAFAAVLTAVALAGCLTSADRGTEPLTGADADVLLADGVFSATHVFPGSYNLSALRTLEAGPFGVGVQVLEYLPSAMDGAEVMVYAMLPDVPEGTRVPIIVEATPYRPDMDGVDYSGEEGLVHNFVSHGYAFAIIAVRGTGGSGGCMDLMGPGERADIDQAITWLGEQPWSNGRIGMYGGSYVGSTQWTAVSTGNPYIKTIVPIAAIPSLFDWFFHNGTANFGAPALFGHSYWSSPLTRQTPLDGYLLGHTLERAMCPSSVEGTATSTVATFTGERDPLGYWAARDYRQQMLDNYQGSVYMVHGFQDATVEPHNAYPLVSELEAKGLVVKHTLGPWGHEAPWRADWMEQLLRWYDRWLKTDAEGGGEAVDIGPKAQVMDNLGRWRSEPSWPPQDATPTPLFLTTERTLADEPEGASGEELVVVSAPLHDPLTLTDRHNWIGKWWYDPAAEVCESCPTFTTVLRNGLRFAGAPTLHLTVTPTGPGGHVTAKMFTVHPDGTRQFLTAGQIDLRFADGGSEASTVVPGQPLVAMLQLQHTDATVPEGGRLEVRLTQGSYGLRLPSLPTYPVHVAVGGETSVLTLPAIERGEAAFHEAPARVGGPAPPR